MTDAVVSRADRQEALSRAYVHAIAAGAGYTVSQPDIDRDSIDLTVAAGGRMRPKLDIQLKATINLAPSADGFTFPLSIKNYDDLRAPTQTPRILVILDMPRQENDWIEVSLEELVLRRAAYWSSLRKFPESDNKTTVTIQIPNSNVFDVVGLRALMDLSRRGVVE